ncbi:hypothetical protein EDD64_12148 [Effusibacillus lacus]|nr:hypothetical protein EDD64_12148 [Effusibacillus lacus]
MPEEPVQEIAWVLAVIPGLAGFWAAPDCSCILKPKLPLQQEPKELSMLLFSTGTLLCKLDLRITMTKN